MGHRTRRAILLISLALTLCSAAYWWIACPVIFPEGWVAARPSWLLEPVLKFGSWVGFLVIMGQVYGAVKSKGRRAAQAALLWTSGMAIVFIPMVLYRDALADWVNSPTTHVLSSTFRGLDHPFENSAVHTHKLWLVSWRDGHVQAVEFAFLLTLSLLHGALSLTPIARWRASGVVAVVATLALSIGFASAFQLLENTYDLFHLGIISAPMAMDLAFPFLSAWPETAIVSPYIFAFAMIGVWLVVRWEKADDEKDALLETGP